MTEKIANTEAKKELTAKTRVFLSYSRKDAAFTGRLAEALSARGYVADYDLSNTDPNNIDSGISAEDEWWLRLQEMITAADVMVIIVSQNSIASPVCNEEIAYARGLGKRLVPVLRRQIDFRKAPPRLSALNVKLTFLDDNDAAFESDLNALCSALDTDIEWYREGRRLTELAMRWHNAGRPNDLHLDRGLTDRAIASYRKAVEVDPYYVWALGAWADALRRDKMLVQAIDVCRLAMEVDPQYAWGLGLWADLLRRKKKFDQSIEKCKEAIGLDPRYAGAYRFWGNALREKKNYDDAIFMYQKGLGH